MAIAGPTRQESRLVAAARSGDDLAFGELYRRYLRDVRDFCARRIRDPLRAEDLAQDTFLRAFERMASFRRGAAFWPWLSTIARNLCIDERRQRRSVVEEVTAAPPEPTEALTKLLDTTAEDALRRQTRERLHTVLSSALETLSDRERRMIWQRAVEEMNWEQIATFHSTTVHAARNSAWRARGALRALLADAVRDLRILVTLPVSVASGALQKLRARWRSHVRWNPHWSLASSALLERGAELMLGVAVLCLPWISTANVRPDYRQATAFAVASNSPVADEDPPASAELSKRVSGHHVDQSLGPVKTQVATESRGQAAAPSQTKYRIEVVTPITGTLYWERTQIDCGDGRMSRLLPPQGPVRAYC